MGRGWAMAVRSGTAGRVFPRILLFGGMTVAMIAATVNELPGLVLGAVGLGWVGSLLALVQATQGGTATEDSGSGEGGDAPDGESDGGADGGGDGGGDGE